MEVWPSPYELMEEWDDLSEDLEKVIHIQSEQVIDYRRDQVVVNDGVTFDDENFRAITRKMPIRLGWWEVTAGR